MPRKNKHATVTDRNEGGASFGWVIREDVSVEVTLTLKLEGEESATQGAGQRGNREAKALRHGHTWHASLASETVVGLLKPPGPHGMSLDCFLRTMGRQI